MTAFQKNLLLFLTLSASCSFAQQHYRAASSPSESAKTFQLHADFGIEPVAAEPDVLSPVDFVFGDNGEAYVVEMGDYPYDAKPGAFKGRIRLLKDSDGDGKIDKSYVFAENLPSATSILPWKGGILVAAAPDILYLKDTNGDFKADSREVLFTGFFAKNSEAQVTSLRYGVDNWIYANNSGQGGTITSPLKPNEKVNVAGSNFRFRLDRNQFEAESGNGQFGLAVDDWGHRFYTQNTLHIQQSPIAWRYLHRHNDLPSYRSDANISDHELEMFQKSETPYWRHERSRRRQVKYDSLKNGLTEYPRDHFTGASGGTFYGGDGFPQEFYGSIFTGEVAGNLIHRDIIKANADSPVFTGTRHSQEKDKEFLAATDPWFRPANLTSGPDGYLYVVDMYRQHIETPVSIPEDLKTDMDFVNGEKYGRIWRIFPKSGTKRNVLFPALGSKTAAELVASLASPNQWWRLNAQRLLIEKQDKSIVPALTKLLNETSDPRTKLPAIYALDGLGALTEEMVNKMLTDPSAGIREHGVILAEKYPGMLPKIIELIKDESSQVAYQASLSAGQFTAAPVMAALTELAAQKSENAWYRLAVLSSIPGSSPEAAEMLLKQGKFFSTTSAGKVKFVEDMYYVAGSRNGKGEVPRYLDILSAVSKEQQWVVAGLTGLAKGAKRSANKHEPDKSVLKSLKKLEDSGNADTKKAAGEVKMALQID